MSSNLGWIPTRARTNRKPPAVSNWIPRQWRHLIGQFRKMPSSPRFSVVFSVSRLLKTFPAGSFNDQPMTPRWPATEGRCQTEVQRRSRNTSRFLRHFRQFTCGTRGSAWRHSSRCLSATRVCDLAAAAAALFISFRSRQEELALFSLSQRREKLISQWLNTTKASGLIRPFLFFLLRFFFSNRLTRCWTINIQNPDTATNERGCVTRWWWRGRRMMSCDYYYYYYTVGSKGSRLKLPATWSVTCFWQTGGNVWHICLFDVSLFLILRNWEQKPAEQNKIRPSSLYFQNSSGSSYLSDFKGFHSSRFVFLQQFLLC